MQKKKIAVIFGGNSTEYEVSLQSAFSVFENINKEKFDIVPIGITRNGDWYHYTVASITDSSLSFSLSSSASKRLRTELFLTSLSGNMYSSTDTANIVTS